jgi:hypothetical protein
MEHTKYTKISHYTVDHMHFLFETLTSCIVHVGTHFKLYLTCMYTTAVSFTIALNLHVHVRAAGSNDLTVRAERIM